MNQLFDEWISEISGMSNSRTTKTFAGVLSEYWEEMVHKNRWNQESTRLQYLRDYNDRILPALADHDRKTIDQYTIEDYQKAVAQIDRMGQRTRANAPYRPYADETLQRFRHLIRVVVTIASEKGLCDDILWGTSFAASLSEKANETPGISRKKLKRSFDVSEEVKIAGCLLRADVDGESLGLLLMYSMGLRNAESCGISFGDIRPMFNHPDCYDLYVYETTIRGSNVLQAGGKTQNAGRIIPIPSKVLPLLLQRKSMVQAYLASISSDCDIDSLPVACRGRNYQTRCSAQDLTLFAKHLFRQLEFSERTLIQIDQELMSDSSASRLKEKEPTAYLFRRNFATHLLILGLTEAETQYIIGHDVEDLYETRNEFVNEERRFAIRKKMMQRPIVNNLQITTAQRIDMSSSFSVFIPVTDHALLSLPLEEGQIYLRLAAMEPTDSIRVSFSASSSSRPLIVEASSGYCERDYARNIDVIRPYQEAYLRQWSRSEAKASG